MSNEITITKMLPKYCKTTNKPKKRIVVVNTPKDWVPTYKQVIDICTAIQEIEWESWTEPCTHLTKDAPEGAVCEDCYDQLNKQEVKK